MGFGTTFQKLIMKPSRKMGRQLEDYVKTTYMGDPNGIEGLRRKRQDNGTDLGKLRSEALANGFNPLTVLRATGGQGFYKNEIPMGRLSSDAFFNTFDRIKQRKYNDLPPVIEPNYSLVEGKGKLQDIMDNNKKLNKQRNIGREIIPGPIEYDVFEDGDGLTKSTKVTGMLRPVIDHRGVQRNWVADPEEMNVITGSLFWTAAELDYQFGKLLNWRRSFYTNEKDNIPMSEIVKKVNKQKINKKYLQTPQLAMEQYKTIRGITNNARKIQDEINGFVRSDY